MESSAPFALFALSALGSAACTGGVLRYARAKLLDSVNERSSHTVPTPRGGGLGLVVAALLAWVSNEWRLGGSPLWPVLVASLAIAALAAVGWWDDHASLAPRTRLIAQFAAAAAVVACVGVPEAIGIGSAALPLPAPLVAALGVVGAVWLVNLTNFMDGIDGIAGSQGLAACLGAAAMLTGAESGGPWCNLGLAFAGACVGFLAWNWPPARIFMGDVGSTALGLVFAALVLAQLRAGVAADLTLLPLAPFVLDATFTLVRRARRGEKLSQAHRSHLYQRLARAWGAHLPVTLVWAALAAIGAVGAWLTQRSALPPFVATVIVAGLYAALVAYGAKRMPA